MGPHSCPEVPVARRQCSGTAVAQVTPSHSPRRNYRMSHSSRLAPAGVALSFVLGVASCQSPADPGVDETDTSASALTAESVVWTSLQNVTATGGSLRKSGG